MSSSEEEYEEIAPLDIVIEIMKRLPPKSLVKFMAVSKQWKSIIRSSRFIADYNSSPHIQPRNHFIAGYNCLNYAILFNDIRFQQLLTLPKSDYFRRFTHPKLIGYCQGLFGFYNDIDYRLVIWNPSIRKSVFIPVPETDRWWWYRTKCCFGFTVVCNTTDPTPFIIIHNDEHPRLQVQIFTLSTWLWTTFSNAPRESLEVTRRMVEIDRFIHWIAYEGDRYLILSCDITSEQFTESYLPPTIAAPTSYTDFDVSPSYLELSKLRESLVLLEEDVSEKEIGVWMMMMEPGVQNSFTKLYTVNLPADSLKQQPNVLGFTKDGQLIVLIKFYLRNQLRLHLYEPDSKCFKDIGISGNNSSRLAGSYMETLLLLDH